MKKQKIILINILFLCIIFSIVIVQYNTNIKKETKIIKQMTESTEVSNLNAQINQLNTSHTEYANSIKTAKRNLATAITNQGVSTDANVTFDVMTENIGKIVSSKTQATATEEQILAGQTAWVNGNKITGTMENKGALNWNPNTSASYTLPAGYYSGGTLDSSNAYDAGYSAGLAAGKNATTVVVKVCGVGGSSSSVGNKTYTLTYPNTGNYSQGDGDTKVSINWK